MAISSYWLHSSKRRSLETGSWNNEFFSLSNQGFNSSFCSPVSINLGALCLSRPGVLTRACSTMPSIPEVRLKTSLTPRRHLGCTELCRAGKNAFGDVAVALSRWKKRGMERERGESKGKKIGILLSQLSSFNVTGGTQTRLPLRVFWAKSLSQQPVCLCCYPSACRWLALALKQWHYWSFEDQLKSSTAPEMSTSPAAA